MKMDVMIWFIDLNDGSISANWMVWIAISATVARKTHIFIGFWWYKESSLKLWFRNAQQFNNHIDISTNGWGCTIKTQNSVKFIEIDTNISN